MSADSLRVLAPPALVELWRQRIVEGREVCRIPLDHQDVLWVIRTGMASLLVEAVDSGQLERPLEERLRAADLWARVRHADSLSVALEIIDACEGRVPPLTLLKGISIGPERYPAAHHRFLGDLDLLTSPEALRDTRAVLRQLGFESDRAEDLHGDADHHLPPLRHPRTGVVVELHSGLFSSRHGLDRSGPFAVREVLAERRPSDLEGRKVFRLSPELQVVYTASHWALRFTGASGPRGLLDMLLLLRDEADSLDWDRILRWLEDRRIAAHLQLMLGCLHGWGLLEIPAPLLAQPERFRTLEPAVEAILIAMVEREQLRGAFEGEPDLVSAKLKRYPGETAPSRTVRSRVRTLRVALATRNLRGLIPLLRRVVWDSLVDPRPSMRRRLLIAWVRRFGAGTPIDAR